MDDHIPTVEEIERAAKLRRRLVEQSRTACPDLYGHLASLELMVERQGLYLGLDYSDDLSDVDDRPY